jgi:hypothetical protein
MVIPGTSKNSTIKRNTPRRIKRMIASIDIILNGLAIQ